MSNAQQLQAKPAHAAPNRNDAMTRLAAGFAHELRNPVNLTLNASAGLCDELAAALETVRALAAQLPELQVVEEQLEQSLSAAQLVERGSERVDDVVTALQDLDVPANDDDLDSVDIRATLREALGDVNCELHESGVRVACHLGPVEPVRGQHAELVQVWSALIDNAHNAMPEGGALAIRGLMTKQHIEVHIRDTGCGISTNNQELIFEPLFTTSASSRGLGLTQARAILRKLGGDLRLVPSEVGATFVASLPR